MTVKMIQGEIRFGAFLLLIAVCIVVVFGWSCSSAPKQIDKSKSATVQNTENGAMTSAHNAPNAAGPTIEISEDSPADTVRVFYERLRENNFRDALLLTNLKPAVAGLNDKEIEDLGVDFRKIAPMVPEKMPISGEIITGKDATVTVNMPNEKDGKMETQELRLRREGNFWIMLVADAEGEARIRQEGKNYFFALRMDVHHEEAKSMLNRIAKAQAVFALQNQGKFADLNTLVQKGFVPSDALGSDSTGYKYDVALAYDRSTYTALATPAQYGRSGRYSFALKIKRGREPEMLAKDNRGISLDG